MKSQTTKQAIIIKKPQALIADKRGETASSSTLVRQPRFSFDDLHARITARAYELYVERGSRAGCELEDWLDAEREILGREFPS